MRSILVTTEHRGVWYAEVDDNADISQPTLTNLKNARMAIYWGTTNGLHELCSTGPTSTSKISDAADIAVLHKVTAVFYVTEKAVAAWKR